MGQTPQMVMGMDLPFLGYQSAGFGAQGVVLIPRTRAL